MFKSSKLYFNADISKKRKYYYRHLIGATFIAKNPIFLILFMIYDCLLNKFNKWSPCICSFQVYSTNSRTLKAAQLPELLNTRLSFSIVFFEKFYLRIYFLKYFFNFILFLNFFISCSKKNSFALFHKNLEEELSATFNKKT